MASLRKAGDPLDGPLKTEAVKHIKHSMLNNLATYMDISLPENVVGKNDANIEQTLAILEKWIQKEALKRTLTVGYFLQTLKEWQTQEFVSYTVWGELSTLVQPDVLKQYQFGETTESDAEKSIASKGIQLSDPMMKAVADRITKKNDLFDLTHNLDIEDFKVEGLENQKIPEWAHAVLGQWRNSIGTSEEAYTKLGAALCKANLGKIAKGALNYPA